MRVLLTLALTRLAFSAQALIIDTYPDWTDNITSGWAAQAQEFVGPSENVLNSWRFSMAAGSGNITFGIFNWNAAGPVGAALYSTTIAWPSSSGPVDVNNINLVLVPGNNYGAVVDLQGSIADSVYFNSNQNSYSAGNGWWMDAALNWNTIGGLNQTFRAVFSPVPEPTSLLVVATGVAFGYRRKKKH